MSHVESSMTVQHRTDRVRPSRIVWLGALFGALGGFLAVALGAFGAHALKTVLDEKMMAVYQTAVQYQMYHCLALVALAGMSRSQFRDNVWIARAVMCFLFGLLVFCGSLYALVFSGQRWIGMITPIGGLAFLMAWLCLALGIWRGGNASSKNLITSYGTESRLDDSNSVKR